MSNATDSTKKAYFARVRHKNYLASLRLEGFDTVSILNGNKRRLSKAEILAIHQRTVAE